MEWIVLFIISWVLFLLLADWKSLKVNIWCGLLAVGFQLFIDTMAMMQKLYEVKDPVLHILSSSAFFGFGPVFVIGTLLAQFHPKKRWITVLHVIILTALYSLQEFLLLTRLVLVYTNWHFYESLFINLIVVSTLSWFSVFILNRGGLKN